MSRSAFLDSLPAAIPAAEKKWLQNFYNCMPADLQKIVDEAAQIKDASLETIQKSIGLIDHTSLKEGDVPMIGTEKPKDIKKLCEEAVGKEGWHTAAVCVYPNQIDTAKKALKKTNVALAVVNNFPHGDLSAEEAAQDAARSSGKGSSEIDTVIDYEKFLAGDIEGAREKLEAVNAACEAEGSKLKIILKASIYPDYQSLAEATTLACEIEPAFVKTCTGKKPKDGYGTGAADASNLLTMATVLYNVAAYNRAHNTEIGVKISGGVKYPLDCEQMRYLVNNTAGPQYFTPALLRIGASSLRANLNPAPDAANKPGNGTKSPDPAPGAY